MDKYIPFAAATVIYIFSPLLTLRAQVAVIGSIARSRGALKDPPGDIPAHVSDAFIEKYIAFAIDAAQVIPAMILTGVATILAIPQDWPPAVAASIFAVTVPVIIGVDAYILGKDPQQYVKKRWKGYSLVSIMGVAVNLIGVILAATLS